jgi:hypothetical protein
MANVKIETTAIKLMIRKAIALGFASELFSEINSISLKSVFVERHEKTQNNASGIRMAIITSGMLCNEYKYPTNIEITPEVPPDIKAVFAFMPIKITDPIPQLIKKNP